MIRDQTNKECTFECMKLRFAGIFFLFLYSLISFTQSRNLSFYGNNLRDHLLIKQQDMVGRVTNEDIKGSPYYKDSFSTATVNTIHTLFKGVPMRYNVHEDYMEFQDNGTTFILDPKIEIRKILLNDQVFSVEPYDDHGKIKLGYFFELDSNGVRLLKKKVIRFQERIPAKALQGSSTPPTYVPGADQFYYRIAGQAAQPIHNVKKMIEDFPDHKKELLSMANRHKIKSNEKDLTELWEYYNKIRIKK